MTGARQLAVVSGATGGIGAATAQRLAADGFAVLALGRRQPALDRLVARIGQSGGRCAGALCDVAMSEDVSRVAALVEDFEPSTLVLVNNAATLGPVGNFGTCDIDAWCAAIDVNLSGVAGLTHALLPHLITLEHSAIVNVSSGASGSPMTGWSAYCASKAGLAMLTRMLHQEYGNRVPVYGFQPGLVDTDMQARIRETPTNEIGRIPRSKLLPVGDPAAIISWLGRARPADLSGTEFRADDPAIRRQAGLKQ